VTVVRLHEGDVSREYPTLHDLLTSVRQPHPAARATRSGEVLATALNGRWELRDAGVSQLAEEYWTPGRRS
jgi:hypothetical protein